MRIFALSLLVGILLAAGPPAAGCSRLLHQAPDQPQPDQPPPEQPQPEQPPPEQPAPPLAPPSPAPQPNSLWELISGRPDLTTLSTLIEAAGLVQLLNDTAMMESLTMLLPSNAAFADFFADMGGVEAEGPELLMSNSIITPVLLYHISEGITPKADFVPGLVLSTRSGDTMWVNRSWDRSIRLRDVAGRTAQVLQWDLSAGTGIGHIIDKVLLPVRPATINEALTWSALTAFQEVAVAAGYGSLLNSTTANVTLLVPTNEAFLAALPWLDMPNMSSLVANRTLCREVISGHILLGNYPWWKLENQQMTYLPTATSCATLYFEQEDDPSPLNVYGAGNIVAQSAQLINVDLVAGTNALAHMLNNVLLPLTKWSSRCHYAFGV